MIEREFISQKTKEFYIKKYIEKKLRGVGISQIRLKKIPLGEKIIIHTSRPSLIVGSKGANIKDLTKHLKIEFKLENPQIEIIEVKNLFLDANVVAERIVGSLERFGSARFKGVGHKVMGNVINSGALGVELIFSGKIPGARAKNWRFYQGYLKKCGDVAVSGVKKAKRTALLKSGVIGIKVSIMPPDIVLPDHVVILDEPIQIVEELPEKAEKKPAKKKTTKRKTTKSTKKATPKKEESKEVPVAEPVEEKKEVPKEEEKAKIEVKEEAPAIEPTSTEEPKEVNETPETTEKPTDEKAVDKTQQ
ncbi:30S ribosomal protein S3 [Candidatus Woesearchaeota archaeon]|jgi:small subunit ribosomal protein S3|nr:30S ribosomal protein S3 [Candidatus Woesearchaeota archaeon]MBT5397336.1 30S ribosomal protein S3 [Candidatus Woesearchaeota archaeon]MBT6367819.1 30S ribosomal protein S3 [Candidatus Woesearchaeota archaeon]MBT7762736.1 30S ribosomal protein S3 [Candidatus Woesearchaeota archaeon]